MSKGNRGIGDRLRMYRESIDKKLREVAGILVISPGSLSELENSKTSPSAATFVSLVLNTDINIYWLLTGAGSMKRSLKPKLSSDGELNGDLEEERFVRIVKRALKEYWSEENDKRTVNQQIFQLLNSFSDRGAKKIRNYAMKIADQEKVKNNE